VTSIRIGPAAPVAAALLVVLTVLVATHVTDGFDRAVEQQLVPSWNQSHQVISDIPDYIAPKVEVVLFAVFVGVLSLLRRSWIPLLVGGLLAGSTVVAVLAVKRIVPRVDTGQHISGAGSFPSGHMATTVMTVGGLLILLVPRTTWWQWLLVALIALGMAVCLLYGDIHWTTDILGGALLGCVMLGLACAIPGRTGLTERHPAAGRPPGTDG